MKNMNNGKRARRDDLPGRSTGRRKPALMTDADFIEALGGAAALSAELKKRHGAAAPRRKTVSVWKRRDIPGGWRAAVCAVAVDRGIAVPPRLLEPKARRAPARA
jgi:hypothetical protein